MPELASKRIQYSTVCVTTDEDVGNEEPNQEKIEEKNENQEKKEDMDNNDRAEEKGIDKDKDKGDKGTYMREHVCFSPNINLVHKLSVTGVNGKSIKM